MVSPVLRDSVMPGAGFRDTIVTPCDRGGHGGGSVAGGRLPQGAHKGRAYGCVGPDPGWWQGIRAGRSVLAWVRIARMSLYFKSGFEIAGSGRMVGRIGAGVGMGRTCVGMD